MRARGNLQIEGTVEATGYKGVPQVPFYLNDAQDVNVPAPADNNVLTFDSASGKWQGESGSGSVTFTDGVNSHTSSTLNFNDTQFYLSTDLSGNPVVNRIREGFTLESELSVDTPDFDFTNIPQTADRLLVIWKLRSDDTTQGAGLEDAQMQWNGVTSGYDSALVAINASAGSSSTSQDGANLSQIFMAKCTNDHVNAIANTFAQGEFNIQDYTSSSDSINKACYGIYSAIGTSDNVNIRGGVTNGQSRSDDAITRIRIFPRVGSNFQAGSKIKIIGIVDSPNTS